MILDRRRDSFTWERVVSPETVTPFRLQGNCRIVKGVLVLDPLERKNVEMSEAKKFNNKYDQLQSWNETKYVVDFLDDPSKPFVYVCETGEEVLNKEREEALGKIGFKEPDIDNARKIFITKKTKVINITGMPKWGQAKDEIYIGRATRQRKGSKWANHFPVEKYGREESIRMYREWIQTQPELMNSLHELKGKTLGCWCKPLACHGDVLVELVERETRKKNQDWQT